MRHNAGIVLFWVLSRLLFAAPEWEDNQPVSVTAEAFRGLTIGGPTSDLIFKAIFWSVLIIAIFAPIAVRLYRKAV
jgi:hypothetical protein